MKEQFTNTFDDGFSTLELLIALSLMSVIISATIVAISSTQYWILTAETANEALYKNKIIIKNFEIESLKNFQLVSSTDKYLLADANCTGGGLCYSSNTKVTDISSCAKEAEVSVEWRVGLRYATSSINNLIFLSNPKEIIASYGDCLVEPLKGDWVNSTPVLGSSVISPPQGNTGIDVFGDYMYVTSITEPYLQIFKIEPSPLTAPVLVGSSTESGLRLNDIDVIKDYRTGRIYAYVMQHSTTSQLAVYDVTSPDEPTLLTEQSLFGVSSEGSFPEGWRVVAYGEQLFVVSRETTGPELHIFSISNPATPSELIGAIVNLNRTVNDMVVRDEIVNTNVRRFLYLAASSDLKEVGVYDVTDVTPIEIAAINLVGSADAISLYLTGNRLYVGRKSNAASEFYAFNVEKLIKNELEVLGVSEVGADVLALTGSGQTIVLGTSKAGAELQNWSTTLSTWSSSVLNAGRLSSINSAKLAPLGFDSGGNNLYLISQSQTQPETVSVIYTP